MRVIRKIILYSGKKKSNEVKLVLSDIKLEAKLS